MLEKPNPVYSAGTQTMSTSIQPVGQSVRLNMTPALTPKVVASASQPSDKVTLSSSTQKSPLPISYIDSIKSTGDINIDAVLAGGNAWWHTSGASGVIPSEVARHDLTY